MLTLNRPSVHEWEKYQRVWANPMYRKVSPGAKAATWLLDTFPWPEGMNVIDVGSGSGQEAAVFRERGHHVWTLDFATPADFTSCLWHQWSKHVLRVVKGGFHLSFCSDVLEHIPIEFTMLVASRVLEVSEFTYFEVCTEADYYEKWSEEPLHVTVQPYAWWRDRLADLGYEMVDARDVIDSGLFLMRRPA